jgi:hypothetical protein
MPAMFLLLSVFPKSAKMANRPTNQRACSPKPAVPNIMNADSPQKRHQSRPAQNLREISPLSAKNPHSL